MRQPTLDGMPERLYPASPGPADDLPRLPAPLPARLPRPTRPAAGAARGATTRSGASVHTPWPGGGTCRRERRTPRAGGALLVERLARPTASATTGSAAAARERSRAQVERYLADGGPRRRPVGGGADGLGPHAARVAVGTRRPHRRPARRGRRGRGLQDRPLACSPSTTRGTSVALAVYAAGGRAHAAPAVHPRRAAPPAHGARRWPGTTPRSRWPSTCERADARRRGAGRARRAASGGGLPRAGADEAFPARVGPQCGWCDVRRPARPVGPPCRHGLVVRRAGLIRPLDRLRLDPPGSAAAQALEAGLHAGTGCSCARTLSAL